MSYAFTTPGKSGVNKDYSDNVVYTTGESIPLAWTPTVDNGSLVLWQDNLPDNIYKMGAHVTLATGVDGTEYNWTVDYDTLNSSYNNVYYLQMNFDSSSFNSHYFNISDSSAAATTSPTKATSTTSTGSRSTASDTTAVAATSSAATTTSGSTAVTATYSLATATPSQSAASQQSIGLTVGQMEGLTIGVTLAAVLFIASLSFFAWRIWKRRRGKPQPPPQHQVQGWPYEQTKTLHEIYSTSPQELNSNPIHEATDGFSHIIKVHEVP